MYEKACDIAELIEGTYDVAVVQRTLLLVVWPEGGQPRAFQGLCPHAKEPLADARFEGNRIKCRHHEWAFDGTTGKCVKGKPCRLTEYPSKIEDGALMVEVEGHEPMYLGGAPPSASTHR
ncbi:MAG TPA: Rieske 2Fe-2S domain-containing protein [Acidisoma sp.]|jgi:toluene monooxygenase system ferredoxin subunit|nr:Rieske 2Fe-2S domain-containing protein [Acidisoma sp.]